jgi:hypothetical protein
MCNTLGQECYNDSAETLSTIGFDGILAGGFMSTGEIRARHRALEAELASLGPVLDLVKGRYLLRTTPDLGSFRARWYGAKGSRGPVLWLSAPYPSKAAAFKAGKALWERSKRAANLKRTLSKLRPIIQGRDMVAIDIFERELSLAGACQVLS